MSQKLKIAFVAYDFPEYSIRHVNEMTEAAEVLLILPEDLSGGYRALLNHQVRFEVFRKPRLRQPLSQAWSVAQLIHKIRKFQPDVVHVQNGHMYLNLALPLIKKYPLVTTIHDVRQHVGDRESGRTPQWLMDFGFRLADHVIVHGQSLVAMVIRELQFHPSRVHCIPHIAIGDMDSQLPITDDGHSILFFGRIWEYKGLEYLIRAAPQVVAEFPKAKFIIAGRGEDMQPYRQLMHDASCFEVHNDWISDSQRSAMFAAASMVVLPYIEASQSGVIPIAYVHEKPVVVSDLGGLPDMVDDGQTGLLVPPRDPRALAEAINTLLRDRDRRTAMGRAGKKKLMRECAPAVIAQQTLSVYRRAIAERRRDPTTAASEKEPVHT